MAMQGGPHQRDAQRIKPHKNAPAISDRSVLNWRSSETLKVSEPFSFKKTALALFFDDLDHMRDLGDHAAHSWGIFQLAGLVHLVQAQPNQRLTLFFGAADRRADLLDYDGLCHGSLSLRFRGFFGRRVILFQDVGDLLATALCHHAGAGLKLQRVQRCADHVVGVLRTDRLGDHVLHAKHLEHGTHRTTGDDAGTGRRGAHDDLAGAVTAIAVMVQGATLAQRYADHLALGLFGGLADRLGHLFGLALAEADTALLIAHDHQCREPEALAALHGFGHPVDRYETIGEFRSFVAVATVTAIVISCHVASFPCGTLRHLQSVPISGVSARWPTPGSSRGPGDRPSAL